MYVGPDISTFDRASAESEPAGTDDEPTYDPFVMFTSTYDDLRYQTYGELQQLQDYHTAVSHFRDEFQQLQDAHDSAAVQEAEGGDDDDRAEHEVFDGCDDESPQDPYGNGYNEGYDAGYEDGCDYRAGYDLGYEDGFNAGHDNGPDQDDGDDTDDEPGRADGADLDELGSAYDAERALVEARDVSDGGRTENDYGCSDPDYGYSDPESNGNGDSDYPESNENGDSDYPNDVD